MFRTTSEVTTRREKLLERRIKNLEKRVIGLPGLTSNDAESKWRPQITNVNLVEVFKNFTSMFVPLLIEADQTKDTEVVNKLLNIMQTLNPHNLSAPDCLENFLQALFKNVVGNNVRREKQFNYMGQCAEDRVFFLLSKAYYKVKDDPSETTRIWKEIYKHCTYRHRDYHMDNRITWLIRRIAKNIIQPDLSMGYGFAFFARNNLPNGKFAAWQQLLNSTSDSKIIWHQATTNLFTSFIDLITDFRIKIFEPYQPLSHQEYSRLKNYVTQQAQTVQDTENNSHIKTMV